VRAALVGLERERERLERELTAAQARDAKPDGGSEPNRERVGDGAGQASRCPRVAGA
jgi:hypothetical protein